MIDVQIFIATYNRSNLVVKAINSVLNQTFKSIELIVSDNSTKVVNTVGAIILLAAFLIWRAINKVKPVVR